MEDLQTLWHKAQQQENAEGLASARIEEIIRQKSHHEFDKFKRVVWWEVVMGGMIVPLIMYFAWQTELRNHLLVAFVLVMLPVGLLGWQYRFLQRMNQIRYEDDVCHYLLTALATLKKYVFNYKVFIVIYLPFGLVLGAIIGHHLKTGGQTTLLAERPENVWMAGGIIISGIALMLFGVHAYINHLYQAKIDRIQTLIHELRASR